MITVGEIINLALKDVGVIGVGETASGEDVADALVTLNQIIADWQTLPTLVPKAPYVLAAFEELAVVPNLPPAYEAALRYSLGELLLTTFSQPARTDIILQASRARKTIKRSNLVIPEAKMPAALLSGRRYGVYCGDE